MKRLPIFLLSKGGLGNQLFVYAYAHELGIKTERQIVILTNWHNRNQHRDFQLEELSKLCEHKINFTKNRYLYTTLSFISKIQFRSGTNLDSILMKIGIFQERNLPLTEASMMQTIFVEGYFQDLKNYSHIQLFVSEIKNYVATFEVLLPSTFSAGHLRRGDYMSEVDNFGILDPIYYEDLVKEGGAIIICTDDRDRALKHWGHIQNLTIFGPDQLSPWMVIAVLSEAKKLFMANSSLSWWAGLIQLTNGGTTFVPQPWFKSFDEMDNRMVADGMIVKRAIWMKQQD